MRVFVTGATGVIGRRLVPLLLGAGHEVTALSRSRENRAALERTGATAREASLFSRDQLLAAVAGHEAIVNLATHIPSTVRMLIPGGWRENDDVRRRGAANLVEAAIAVGVGRFIQESFAPIYADHGDAWIDETWEARPVRYNRSVLDAEAAARRFTASGRVGIVLRFAAFYGPDSHQLAEMIRGVRHGWALLPGPAGSYFSSVAHDDAATAVLAALGAPAGTYNVVDDQPLRHRELVDALADAVGAPHPRLPPPWMTSLGGSLGRMFARSQRISNKKLREASGWTPRYPSVREGFPAAVASM